MGLGFRLRRRTGRVMQSIEKAHPHLVKAAKKMKTDAAIAITIKRARRLRVIVCLPNFFLLTL